MTGIIKDGTGKDYPAQVTLDNKLCTTGDFESAFSFAGQKGKAANGGTGVMNVTTMTTGTILWTQNTSDTLFYRVMRVNVNWNGGSTNYNRPLQVTLYRETPEDATPPTANNALTGFGNTRFDHPFTPPMLAYKWVDDGSTLGHDVGMTHTPGTFVGSIFGGPGLTVSATDGAFIFPPKHAVSIQISTPEDGTLNISYQGYFEELQ